MDFFMEQFMDDLAERVAEKLARRQPHNVMFAPPPRHEYRNMTVYDGCGSSARSGGSCGSESRVVYDRCGNPTSSRWSC